MASVPDLLERWLSNVRAAAATTDDAQLRRAGEELLARWAEPHRRYHDTTHLRQVLQALDELASGAIDAPAVRLAAWFHDAVYAGRPGRDEQDSAELAGTVLAGLGVPADRVAAVQRLVRLTAAHDPAPDDADGAALCDADLSILAADPGSYAGYTGRVRQENAGVPDAAFRAGRTQVLRALLAAPRLYRTEAGRRWEQAARRNVSAELRELAELPALDGEQQAEAPG